MKPSPTESLPAHIVFRLTASAAFWIVVASVAAVAYAIKHL